MILATKSAESMSRSSASFRHEPLCAQWDLLYAALERRQHGRNPAQVTKPAGWLYVLISHGRPALLLENKRVILNPGDFVIVGPDCHIEWTDQLGAVSDRLVWLWRTGPRCTECAVEPTAYRVWKVNTRSWREFEQLHALCCAEVQRSDSLSALALDQLHGAVDVAAARHLSRKGRRALPSARMELAMHWMAQNLAVQSPVAGLCDYLQISPATLCRMFQAHHGESPGAYHQRLKMARASEMLVVDQRPVKDVAFTLGYRHPNDFSRAFKRFAGVSPTAKAIASPVLSPNRDLAGSGLTA